MENANIWIQNAHYNTVPETWPRCVRTIANNLALQINQVVTGPGVYFDPR